LNSANDSQVLALSHSFSFLSVESRVHAPFNRNLMMDSPPAAGIQWGNQSEVEYLVFTLS